MAHSEDNVAAAATLAAGYTRALGDDSQEALLGTLLATRWQERGVTPDLLVPDHAGTMGRGYATRAGVLPPDSIAGTRAAVEAAPSERVTLGEVIGEGAMGIVRSAQQDHLRRTVAVKEPRLVESEEAPDPEIVGALLREAWISGNLEHPNIVPVHLLSRDGHKPLIIMKRIEGRAWSELLREDFATTEERGVAANAEGEAAPRSVSGVPPERLERHLEIFAEVCHAIHFAHSRGVLHLDLKPDNVMVGEFGEVYVLDWGIAAGFGDERPAWMPDATAIRSVLGTPGYLSPEQAEGDGEMFSIRTDVYLLGAVLHEILVGERLHPGSLVASLISSHRAVPPSYDATPIPPELAAIVQRAVAANPEERFVSVESMRLAIEEFVAHRRSSELTAKGMRLLLAVDKAHQDPVGDDTTSDRAGEGVDEALVHDNRVTECRFAFQQALRVWPDNQAATHGLTRLLTLLVERACARRDLGSAAAALSEHPAPTKELRDQVASLRASLQEDRAEEAALHALGEQHDLLKNQRQRFALSLVSGFTWFIWNYAVALLDKQGILPLNHTWLMVNWGLSAGTFALVIYTVGRSRLLATAINRRGIGIIWGGFTAVGVLWAGAAMMDVDPLIASALAQSIYVAGAACLAATVDRRLWAVWGLMAIPMIGSFVQPHNAFEWSAYMGLFGGIMLGWIWRTPPELPADDREDGTLGGPRGVLEDARSDIR